MQRQPVTLPPLVERQEPPCWTLPPSLLQVQSRAELQDGESLFQWLIAPVDVTTFDDDIEEQRPLLVTREHNRTYFDGLFSKAGAWQRRKLAKRVYRLPHCSRIGLYRSTPHCCVHASCIALGSFGGRLCRKQCSTARPEQTPPAPAEIDRLLRAGQLQYQYNIDVVAYKDEKRQNYNYNGKQPPEVDGASWSGSRVVTLVVGRKGQVGVSWGGKKVLRFEVCCVRVVQ